MSGEFYGGNTLARLDTTASPNAYETIENVKSVSGISLTNPLIDVTNYQSTAKEYIGGLPDGAEITIEMSRTLAASSVQDKVKTDVNNQTNGTYRLTMVDTSVSPNLTYTATMTCVPLSWSLTPNVEDANMISFTLKISGSITEA